MHNAPLVATVGNFDGVHIGHQQIIARVVEQARACGGIPTVITFNPLPRLFLHPTQPFFQLMSFAEKQHLLKALGIQQVIKLRFNAALMLTSAEDFITRILHQQCQVKHIIVGDDFRFGHQQQGDISLLKQRAETLGMVCETLPVTSGLLGDTIAFNGSHKISSSTIRHALLQGDLKQVADSLGRPFTMTGRVMHGQKLGRTWGIPTANIAVHRHQRQLQGIYIVNVLWNNQTLPGVASIGTRPTLQPQANNRLPIALRVAKNKTLLEVHLLDFNNHLYGQRITVEFIEKIRDEARFDSIDALREQIEQDVAHGRAHFKAALTEGDLP